MKDIVSIRELGWLASKSPLWKTSKRDRERERERERVTHVENERERARERDFAITFFLLLDIIQFQLILYIV